MYMYAYVYVFFPSPGVYFLDIPPVPVFQIYNSISLYPAVSPYIPISIYI